jgi:hypothetical protein
MKKKKRKRTYRKKDGGGVKKKRGKGISKSSLKSVGDYLASRGGGR